MFKSTLLILAVLLMSKTQGSVNFKCFYETATIVVIGNLYRCEPEVTISGESRTIDKVEGTHQPGRTNDDVEYLMVRDQQWH